MGVAGLLTPTKFEMDAHELGKPKQEWIMAPFNRSFVDAVLHVARIHRKGGKERDMYPDI